MSSYLFLLFLFFLLLLFYLLFFVYISFLLFLSLFFSISYCLSLSLSYSIFRSLLSFHYTFLSILPLSLCMSYLLSLNLSPFRFASAVSNSTYATHSSATGLLYFARFTRNRAHSVLHSALFARSLVFLWATPCLFAPCYHQRLLEVVTYFTGFSRCYRRSNGYRDVISA